MNPLTSTCDKAFPTKIGHRHVAGSSSTHTHVFTCNLYWLLINVKKIPNSKGIKMYILVYQKLVECI